MDRECTPREQPVYRPGPHDPENPPMPTPGVITIPRQMGEWFGSTVSHICWLAGTALGKGTASYASDGMIAEWGYQFQVGMENGRDIMFRDEHCRLRTRGPVPPNAPPQR